MKLPVVRVKVKMDGRAAARWVVGASQPRHKRVSTNKCKANWFTRDVTKFCFPLRLRRRSDHVRSALFRTGSTPSESQQPPVSVIVARP